MEAAPASNTPARHACALMCSKSLKFPSGWGCHHHRAAVASRGWAEKPPTVRIGDLTVNRLGFGAMRVCGTNIWGPPKNRAAAHALPISNTLKRIRGRIAADAVADRDEGIELERGVSSRSRQLGRFSGCLLAFMYRSFRTT